MENKYYIEHEYGDLLFKVTPNGEVYLLCLDGEFHVEPESKIRARVPIDIHNIPKEVRSFYDRHCDHKLKNSFWTKSFAKELFYSDLLNTSE
jgi:hypothetical protein